MHRFDKYTGLLRISVLPSLKAEAGIFLYLYEICWLVLLLIRVEGIGFL